MPPSIRQLLRSHGIFPKKGLSQNFLTDPTISNQIVNLANVHPGDRVVEIGPGIGSLTQPLLKQCEVVHAIEMDDQLIPILKETTQNKGTLHIIQGDALKINYTTLANQLGGPIHIVANLPYRISSPLLFHLLEQRHTIASMTLMFQKEVAQRLTAPPNCKDYGALTVQCQMWMDVEKVLDVPPDAFHPVPKVTSAVVHFLPRQKPVAEIPDPAWFNQVVRTAFGQRRKTLKNALKPLDPDSGEWLKKADIDPIRRGETLTLTEFAHLARIGLAKAIPPEDTIQS
ncbi:MAG: ribosomal RNA small subunit methyltransferase A [Magnetococcales bacterium]|nr:ribosomal RNA small subunit methyltransferase A [Magnetococcales bacterium]